MGGATLYIAENLVNCLQLRAICSIIAVSFNQCRINYCVGCTMGGAPAARGPPINCQIFTTFWQLNVWTFSVGLNVTMTTKKVVDFGDRKVHAQRKSWLRVWEKGPCLTLVWGPRMVNGPSFNHDMYRKSPSLSAFLVLDPSRYVWGCKTKNLTGLGDRSFAVAGPRLWICPPPVAQMFYWEPWRIVTYF